MRSFLLLTALLVTTSFAGNNSQTAINNNTNMINFVQSQVTEVDTKVTGVDSKVTGIDDKVSSVESKIHIMQAEIAQNTKILNAKSNIHINVVGQGVAPMDTASPAQAYALAKRAATADAYRLIAEKIQGVKIDGHDTIKNMMVKRSIVRTSVSAIVRDANLVSTTFKEGLCEVEMEVILSYSQFAQR